MNNDTLTKLTSIIAKLPGLGPRSARRLVLHLIKNRQNVMQPLIEQLTNTAREIQICKICGNLDVINPCNICIDDERNLKTLCIVETVADLWALERSNFFKGKYHIIGGTLSALNNRTPETLNLETLKSRVIDEGVNEVIIATNATLEGQTTGHYIVDLLSTHDVKITRLAYGIPMGAELDYMDEGTLGLALKMRQSF